MFATLLRFVAAGISNVMNAKFRLCGSMHALYGMYEIGSSDGHVLSWTIHVSAHDTRFSAAVS